MNPPSGPANTSIATRWRYHVLHASAGYWIAQALLFCLHVGFGAVMMMGLVPVEDAPVRPQGQVLLRLCLDSLLLLTLLHLVVRPILLMCFIQRKASWAGIAAGLAGLAVLGYASLMASMWLGRLLTPQDGMDFQQIRFHAGEAAYDFDLGTGQLILLGSFNQFSVLLLWSLLYLAWKAFESRRQLQQQVREARLQQLTHQLSPHFLFNAFNSIRAMIFEDRERAAGLVTQLSELFRFHLGSGIRTRMSLAEDWEVARRYLDIEAVRLESRLRLEVALAPELMERSLPTLTLLTLVENAVKHGIAPNRDGGWLAVRALPAGDGWRLEVENSVGHGVAGYSGGHGLSNLRERMSLSDDGDILVVNSGDRFLVRMEFAQ